MDLCLSCIHFLRNIIINEITHFWISSRQGGAIAIAMEKFANKVLLQSEHGGLFKLQSMTINYMSTAKKSLMFELEGAFEFTGNQMLFNVNVKREDGSIAVSGVLQCIIVDENKINREVTSRL